MAKLGSKKISQPVKKQLQRKSARLVRSRRTTRTVLENHSELVESFTKEEYLKYEALHHKWGSPGRKRQVLLSHLVEKGIEGPVLQLAEIRVHDLNLHQKLLQVLRYRWMDVSEYQKNKVNSDPNLFWHGMAVKLNRSKKERDINVSKKWEGNENKEELVNFLIKLYEKQNGKCAISGVTLELQLGTDKPLPNKCSLDRINSNNGYTPQNVWFVAWWVNAMKSDMSMDTFKERIKLLYESEKFDNKSK
jgi:hypothetical protein